MLKKYPDKYESGCAICCGNAKLIFESKAECRALKIISESKYLESNVISNSKKIMDKQC